MTEEATVANFATVQSEDDRQVSRNADSNVMERWQVSFRRLCQFRILYRMKQFSEAYKDDEFVTTLVTQILRLEFYNN